MTKRIFTLFLALALLLVAVPVAVPVSAAYENTHTNTGNQRHDIIQVALTQVGYQEGKNNYNKYGEYFGNANTAWCGWFVSWCAAQAKVPTSVIKRQGIASASSFGFSGKTFKASEKLPQSGDLYFKSGHLGFVWKVEGKYFWTVEGNSSDQVECEKLNLYSGDYWFASPKYGGSNNASHTHTLETGYENAHPHKEYKACTSCDYKTYTGGNRSVADCTDCIQENCNHTYGDWESTGDSKHKKVCTLCGKSMSDSHDWDTVEITKDPTCYSTGNKVQECAICGARRNKSISKTDDHSYGDWEYKNDESHQRKCSLCGKTVTKDHKVDEDAWQTTEEEHWKECETCEEKFLLGEHAFGEKCTDPCKDCNYVRPEGHAFGDNWITDGENHWRECAGCGEISSVEEHIYSAACDEDCDVCGLTREVTHSYPEEMDIDETSHWYECDVCGKIEGLEEHIPGPEATEEHAQNCTVCGYELAAQIIHVHDYAPIYGDNAMHWGTCRCGDELGPEVHAWDMATGTCSVCGVASVAETESQSWEFVWYIIGGAVLVTAIITVSVMASSRKKRKQMEADPYWA